MTVKDHSELGQTISREDGRFDLVVNGGGLLVLEYVKSGYLPVQRDVEAAWQEYLTVPEANAGSSESGDVVMIPVDDEVTDVALGADATTMQVAQGSPVTDADGTRQSTLLFSAGTTATMTLPNGSTQPLAEAEVRATEYTVGDRGPEAMPGDLPQTSGYTYAAEFSVDEALTAGATNVEFSKPVATYVDNFAGFPVGSAVPAGYYDREKADWVPAKDGRVIEIVGESGGMAEVDSTGDGVADDALAMSVAERQQLATLYDAGDELWRVLVTHFTP